MSARAVAGHMPFFGHRTCADWVDIRGIARPLTFYETKVLAMFHEGASQYAIAKRFGVTPPAVHHFLRKRGLLRTRKAA